MLLGRNTTTNQLDVGLYISVKIASSSDEETQTHDALTENVHAIVISVDDPNAVVSAATFWCPLNPSDMWPEKSCMREIVDLNPWSSQTDDLYKFILAAS